jgi:nucleoside triphosphate diphosphatase
MAQQKIMTDSPSVETVLELIAILRSEAGCPWDRKQTPATLSVYLIEEVYELVEAITANDAEAIAEEMGDVIFQILFIASLYQHEPGMALEAVLDRILRKMIRRHPHVFGKDKVEHASEVKKRWREIKQAEKNTSGSLMDSVPSGLPALMRAYRISERAAGTGFDWDALEGVMSQVEAEWSEFKAEIHSTRQAQAFDKAKVMMEFGDVMFTMVNVARLAGFHPETALSHAVQKFGRRFKRMEAMAAGQSIALDQVPRDEKEQFWKAAKKMEQ